jgi:hypothetical protein
MKTNEFDYSQNPSATAERAESERLRCALVRIASLVKKPDQVPDDDPAVILHHARQTLVRIELEATAALNPQSVG